MNCYKKAAVNVLHRSFYVIKFIMCRFLLIIIRCAWYFSAIMRNFLKGFFHGLKLGFKAWFIGISSVSAIICICQVLG